MGDSSKELKSGRDYYIVVKKLGEEAPAGWLQRRNHKAGFTPFAVQVALKNKPAPAEVCPYHRQYYLYPGPKPRKAWGPTMP